MTEINSTHLRHVTLKGFKSIQALDLNMEPINILIGANGSGKSNFISLFTFLRNLSEGKLQNYVEKQGFANSFFYFGSKKTPTIEVGINIGTDSSVSAGIDNYYVVFEHNPSDDLLTIKHEHLKISLPKSVSATTIKGTKGESGLLSTRKGKLGIFSLVMCERLKKCRAYHFHDTGPSAGFKQAWDVTASDYLHTDAGNIGAFLYSLKNNTDVSYSKSYTDIVTAIQTVAPYFHDFYLEPRGSEANKTILLKWIHRDHETPFSAHQLSDGTARFICMATLFLQPLTLRPKSIILDEPELGLHPAALEVLAEIVKTTSKTNQVILSTQSVTFANQFAAKDFIVVDQNHGASTFKRVNEEELKDWLEEYSMGDIWTKNLIGGRPEW